MSFMSTCESTTKKTSIVDRIKSEIADLPNLKAKFDAAKAKLQASPYADAEECRECEGAGRYMASYCVGYDDYDHEEELCDHCVMEGVYAWDVNRSWFDHEAASASLDPTLDEDEREDALHDIFMEQAWESDMTPPQVIEDYDRAYYDYTSSPYGIANDLEMLQYYCEEDGYGDIEKEWITSTMEEVKEIIESMETIK